MLQYYSRNESHYQIKITRYFSNGGTRTSVITCIVKRPDTFDCLYPVSCGEIVISTNLSKNIMLLSERKRTAEEYYRLVQAVNHM